MRSLLAGTKSQQKKKITLLFSQAFIFLPVRLMADKQRPEGFKTREYVRIL